MKKLLIGLCAASLLAASAIGYAGTVTFVNKYDQPVTFVVSQGAVYNPVAGGTVMAGQTATMYVPGTFDTNTQFLAYPPYQTDVVFGCGVPTMPINDVTVRAGWNRWTGMFGCRAFGTEGYQQFVKHHEGCHKHHHHHMYYSYQG